MVRNNRMMTRIFFGVVLAAGLLGAIITSSMWRVDVANLEMPGLEENADWVDAASLIGEQFILFFLGWTN